MLTVGSLFSGIGGLDLGLERAGMEVIWQSEIDPYASKVLAKHWPKVPNYGNIKEIKWGDVVRPDSICGGYPCQPFSTAGKRNGTDDPRHLWPWVREAISELRPKYAILENVRGHVSLGLNVVLGEMASIGYDAEWQIVSAASVGAPHRRDRVIIVAYPNGQRPQGSSWVQEPETELGRPDLLGSNKGWISGTSNSTDTVGELANTDSFGHLRRQSQIFTTDRWLNALSLIGSCSADVANPYSSDTPNGGQCEGVQSQDTSWRDDRSGSRSNIGEVSVGSARQNTSDVANTDDNGSSSTTLGGSVRTPTDEQSSRQDNSTDTQGRSGISREMANTDSAPRQQQQERKVCEPNIGGRSWWQVEPDVGRVANGVPSRVDRLKGLGNAVVPQVAELIGRMVIDYDTNL